MSNGRIMRMVIAACGLAAAALNIAYLAGALPRSVTSTGALLILLCWGVTVIQKRVVHPAPPKAEEEQTASAADPENPDRVQNTAFDRAVGGVAAGALLLWIITLGLSLFHGS